MFRISGSQYPPSDNDKLEEKLVNNEMEKNDNDKKSEEEKQKGSFNSFNTLNNQLQGKDKCIIDTITKLNVFLENLALFFDGFDIRQVTSFSKLA